MTLSDSVECPFCGEVCMEVANRIDGTYYGKSFICINGECWYCHDDRTVLVRPVTLCDHEDLKRVPGDHHWYCSDCGQLQIHFEKGYCDEPAPWERDPTYV